MMKIGLIERTSARAINKDQMGGYGINTQVGGSFFAKWIMRQKKSIRNVPILSLAYLASIFSKDGHNVKVMDWDNISSADLFIIPSSTVDHRSELDTASKIREKYPKAKIGFTGPFAVFLADKYLQFGDFIIEGEPEEQAIKISKGLIPKGIVKSAPIENLDMLPFPKWDLFNIERYCYFPTIRKKPFLTMQSSRGCALSCAYCPYLTSQSKWRARSVNNVIEEIKYLKDRFKVKGLLFRDPIFTLNKERAGEIAERMRENKFDIKWACETKPDLLDEKLVDRMHMAGLRAINFGIESSRQDLLEKAGRKALDTRYQEKIIRYCEGKGIKIVSFYLLGLPDDNKTTISETVRYAKKLNTFIAQFHIFTPFPGTKYYHLVKDRITEDDWEKFNAFTPITHNNNLPKETLNSLKEHAFVTYYFRIAYFTKHIKHLLLLWKKILPF